MRGLLGQCLERLIVDVNGMKHKKIIPGVFPRCGFTSGMTFLVCKMNGAGHGYYAVVSVLCFVFYVFSDFGLALQHQAFSPFSLKAASSAAAITSSRDFSAWVMSLRSNSSVWLSVCCEWLPDSFGAVWSDGSSASFRYIGERRIRFLGFSDGFGSALCPS